MRILFDQGTPAPLMAFLSVHIVETMRARGWDTLANGELLITTDKNLRYQQNLTGRVLAIVVLGTPQWPVVRAHVDQSSGSGERCYCRQLH